MRRSSVTRTGMITPGISGRGFRGTPAPGHRRWPLVTKTPPPAVSAADANPRKRRRARDLGKKREGRAPEATCASLASPCVAPEKVTNESVCPARPPRRGGSARPRARPARTATTSIPPQRPRADATRDEILSPRESFVDALRHHRRDGRATPFPECLRTTRAEAGNPIHACRGLPALGAVRVRTAPFQKFLLVVAVRQISETSP